MSFFIVKFRMGFFFQRIIVYRKINIFKKEYTLINIRDLNRFDPGSSVDMESLVKSGLVKKEIDGVKLLGDGEISFPVTVKVHNVSKNAREKIEAAGGTVEVI